MKFSVQIYTDGSCCARTRAGGWAFYVVQNNRQERFGSGSEYDTTNNRMELQAVIQALKQVDNFDNAEVYSDSVYVVDCFKKKWHVTWRKENWMSSKGVEVKNRDLWEQLLQIVESRFGKTAFYHVKGHTGHKWNELAHDAASLQRKLAIEDASHWDGV
jgi:ribonuclease HI